MNRMCVWLLLILSTSLIRAEGTSPVDIVRGFDLGKSLGELRSIGVRATDWVTAGDPKVPGPEEWGICKEFGAKEGQSYEFQIEDEKVSYGRFSFGGDGVTEKVLEILERKYGKLEKRVWKSSIQYNSDKGPVEVRVRTLDPDDQKKRDSKTWIDVKIGKDGRDD